MGDVPSASSGATNDFEFGVDPSLDPELAMVRDTFIYCVQLDRNSYFIGLAHVNGGGASTAGCGCGRIRSIIK